MSLVKDERQNNSYKIIIRVACRDGEDSMSYNTIEDDDISVLNPLLQDIKEHRGYFPSGSFIEPDKPSAKDLYDNYVGWDILGSILPKPKSGIIAIIDIMLYKENPLIIDMV